MVQQGGGHGGSGAGDVPFSVALDFDILPSPVLVVRLEEAGTDPDPDDAPGPEAGTAVVAAVNRRGADVLGQAEAELVGRALSSVLADASAAAVEASLRRAASIGGGLVVQGVAWRRDEVLVHGWFRAQRLSHVGADEVLFTVVLQERMPEEDQAEAAEQRLRVVVDHLLTGLVVLDRRGRVVKANPAMARVAGEVPSGRVLAGLFAPADRPRVARWIATLGAEVAVLASGAVLQASGAAVELSGNLMPLGSDELHAMVRARPVEPGPSPSGQARSVAAEELLRAFSAMVAAPDDRVRGAVLGVLAAIGTCYGADVVELRVPPSPGEHADVEHLVWTSGAICLWPGVEELDLGEGQARLRVERPPWAEPLTPASMARLRAMATALLPAVSRGRLRPRS